MKVIEDNVIPIAQLMIFGMNRVALDPKSQQKLAAWAYLRTLVIQQAADPTGLSIDRYHEFFSLKDRPPETSFVWVGAFSNSDINNAYFSSAGLDYVSGEARFFTRETPAEAYVATLAVGDLAMRTFVYSPLLRVSGSLPQVRNDPYESRLVPIWIPVPSVVNWPAATIFDLAGLDTFIQTPPTIVTGRYRPTTG